ncbi:MAG: right-handed parallel beta-helix repeat-containing protein [Candidatus Heimdallarchaeota archaeon]
MLKKSCVRINTVFPILLLIILTWTPAITSNSAHSRSWKKISSTIKRRFINPAQNYIGSSHQYETHSIISIDGDVDFATQAQAENWPGNGSSSFPYIIENLAISGPGSSLIQIKDSNVHFLIRNCLLEGGQIGVYLNGIVNGQIYNNIIISHNLGGVRLDNAFNCTIFGNRINNNGNFGLLLEYSKDNLLSDNIISNNHGDGISFLNSGNNRILNNKLINTGFNVNGAQLGDFVQTIIVNNTVNQKPLVYSQHSRGLTIHGGAGQVILVNATDISITDQTLSNTSIGILGAYSTGLSISNNIVTDNSGDGIFLLKSQTNRVRNNTLRNNGNTGISIVDALDGEILRNLIRDNDGSGVFASDSESTTIGLNTITNNNNHGIWLSNSINIAITSNSVMKNVGDGLRIERSESSVIYGNQMSNNGMNGVFLGTSNGNSIRDNFVSNNLRSGIEFLDSGGNNVLDNRFINNGISMFGTSQFGGGIRAYIQAEFDRNFVNDLPLIYWKHKTGETIPSGAGQVILVNSSDIIISGQHLFNSITGIFAVFSSDLYIHDNIIENNSRNGISLFGSKNNRLSNNLIINNRGDGISLSSHENGTIMGNSVDNNGRSGIFLDDSEYTSIFGNQIDHNSDWGILLSYSRINTIERNMIGDNDGGGIYMRSSNLNYVFWNDFLSNGQDSGHQARDDGLNNTFSYNYWDDWRMPDSDINGYVDNPYLIFGSAANQDRFPRVSQLNGLNQSHTIISLLLVIIIIIAIGASYLIQKLS